MILTEEAKQKGVTFENSQLLVPDNTSLNEPLQYTVTGETSLSIHIGTGSNVSIQELLDLASDANIVISLTAGNNCNINFVSINSGKTESVVNVKRRITLGDNTKLESIYAKTGSKEHNEKRLTELVGNGSSCVEYDVFFANNNQQFNTVSDMINIGQDTNGEVHMHGVLDHASKASCVGNMKIPRGAIGSSSELSQHILLLTNDAKADIYPYLEIEENDVKKAAHGATIRPLNTDHLFYLRARGLSEEESRKTLVMAFLMPFLDQMEGPIKEKLLNLVNEKWSQRNVITAN